MHVPEHTVDKDAFSWLRLKELIGRWGRWCTTDFETNLYAYCTPYLDGAGKIGVRELISFFWRRNILP